MLIGDITMDIRQGLLGESKSIARVLNESIQIVAKSKNLETIRSRYELILSYIDRLIEIDSLGYRFVDNSPAEMRNQIPGLVNKRI